jgi:prepilin signal peptidase PulO-like enzyme (type II secretory pathway)
VTVDFLPAGLVGLALGSFLNVVITRLPRGESVWAGWQDNTVFGFPFSVIG